MSAIGLNVSRLGAADHDRWDEFVRQAKTGTFYHLSGWKTLIESVLNHKAYYLYCEDDGEIIGVLPLARVKSWLFGDALISTPFLVYGGPVAASQPAAEVLVEAARNLACELGVDYLELRNRIPLEGDWHTKDTHVTFRKCIEPDPAANLMAIPRKQRAIVRKGIKAGLRAELDQNVDRLYEAMLLCKRNLGTPFFGAEWLQAIKDEFKDQVEITTITHHELVICSVMSFRYRSEILPYYGGGGGLARAMNGNDFMYWAVMERASKNGVEIFDYGRSKKDTGAYRFKKHWGFEPTQLHYQYYLVCAKEVSNNSPSNPRFQLLIEAWKRLPLGLAKMLGPSIARLLG